MAGSYWNPRVGMVVVCVLLLSWTLQEVSAATRQQDVNALNGLSQGWSVPAGTLNWGSGDPCEVPWDGVTCDSANVTVKTLALDGLNLNGQISPAIGGLTGLTSLDLCSNPLLSGPIPHEIGQMTSLITLSIQYCNLTGPLPSELGHLKSLQFLGLNGNKINGPLPAELGNTSLTWLDVSSNQISGDIPVANATNALGLDNLTTIVHFHLNNNSLTGTVPAKFFSLPNIMHVLLNYNRLSQGLPNVTDVSQNLTVIRVDFNNLTGPVPSGFTNIPNLQELHLAHNQFSGPVPNFTDLTSLQFLDLSENKFDPLAQFPDWVTSLTNLNTLNLVKMNISGTIPYELFNLPKIQAIDLSSNQLSGALTFQNTTGPSLVSVNLENNDIVGFSGSPSINNSNPWNLTISLEENPICNYVYFNLPHSCGGVTPGVWTHPPIVTSTCSGQSNSVCAKNQSLNWYTCSCAYPLVLQLQLTAPTFSNLDEGAVNLEKDLNARLGLASNQTFVNNMVYEPGAFIVATVWVFPESGERLPKSVSNNITLLLRHHSFSLPEGPYLLLDSTVPGNKHNSKLGTGAIIGIAIGATAGVLIVAASIVFAVVQKRRADRAVMSNPFASWGGGSAEFGEAPKLKGARWFSLAELKEYTNNWSDDNMIGVGGYGKVYRGELPNGDLVAIKRATEGSMQGANEFKNEIELLSRVHHRNLLGLVGFCYEGGEQALIYEFMSNGTLNDHLKAYSTEPLSWEARLEIALASAIGLNYLHDHASPPIIHRDIKSANILLNDKMVAKVADFGLSKLAPDEGEKLVYSVNVKGTLGYLDPEYYMTQNLTDKSDVYSFGVVLLEILTARQPIDQGKFVVREFRSALDRGGVEALRPLLDPPLQNLPTSELEPYLKIALSCVEEEGASRPTTAEIVKQLQALDIFAKPKGSVRAMDVEGGGKKVKFADEFDDQQELLSTGSKPESSPEGSYPYRRAPDSFQYSGAYGVTTTVKPK